MAEIKNLDTLGENRRTFWTKFYNHRLNREDYRLNEPEIREFLKDEGFRRYNNEIILLSGRIAEKVSPDEIFLHSLRYIDTFQEPYLEALFIKRGESLLLKSRGIILSLPDCELMPLRDSQFISYKCYKQGILVVESGKDFKILPYEEAPGFVWKRKILNREFNLFSEEQLVKGDFATFVSNITNDLDHFDSVCSALGYLLHEHKDQRTPIAILINDENIIDEGKPEGGSGKGLLVKGASKIVEKASYNGKNADFTKDKFAYQNVEDTTQILFIDDVPRNFNFEGLFSALTDDLPIEKKHQQTKLMPYEDSPKFVITTNYTINGSSSSFKRRRFDIFLNNFYNAEHTPTDDFGKEFFHGWSEYEWQLFDHFMMSCLRLYLSVGLRRYEDKTWELKMLKNETSADFVEIMDEMFSERMIQYEYASIRQNLVMRYGEKYYFLNKDYHVIIDWVSRYASFNGLIFKKGRKSKGVSFTFKM